MTDVNHYPSGTVEYLTVTVTADVELNTQPVDVSFDKAEWLPAEWIGVVGTTRQARTTAPVTFTATRRDPRSVWVRVTDVDESPILLAGSVTVIP